MHKIELMADPVYPGSNILVLLVAPEYFSTLFKLLHEKLHCYRSNSLLSNFAYSEWIPVFTDC